MTYLESQQARVVLKAFLLRAEDEGELVEFTREELDEAEEVPSFIEIVESPPGMEESYRLELVPIVERVIG